LKKSLLFDLLKFAMLHPKIGVQIVQSALQSYNDSKQDVKTLDVRSLQVSEVINNLFPHTTISLVKLRENLTTLHNYLTNFFEKLENKNYPSKEKPYPIDYSLDDSSSLFLYILCKIVKPDTVVETGVAYGRSSSYILQALSENNKGNLYSIDSIFRPWESKQMIGSVIPKDLTNRWKFIFGPSSTELKKLLDKLGMVDIFFHDSLHTSKNMMFEFETAWPFIKNDGFLISDDITGNNAFYKFSKSKNLQPIIISSKNKNSMIGILHKF